MDQQQIIQIQMFEQEAQQLNQQLQLIEQNVSEMQDLELSLDEIEKKENNEILANLGKGIYIPVEIKDKKLIVEVGNKNFIKKTIPEAKEIIREQLVKLISAKSQISERLNALQSEIGKMMEGVEKESKKEDKKEKK
jgi:prefoldin alpha subunit|tara:strand:+ start:118 stop:528 length:411 start_codon:yes stop_codon:yes gene_type:complete